VPALLTLRQYKFIRTGATSQRHCWSALSTTTRGQTRPVPPRGWKRHRIAGENRGPLRQKLTREFPEWNVLIRREYRRLRRSELEISWRKFLHERPIQAFILACLIAHSHLRPTGERFRSPSTAGSPSSPRSCAAACCGRVAQLAQRLGLDLADALACHLEVLEHSHHALRVQSGDVWSSRATRQPHGRQS